jgi:hypothetical protein
MDEKKLESVTDEPPGGLWSVSEPHQLVISCVIRPL